MMESDLMLTDEELNNHLGATLDWVGHILAKRDQENFIPTLVVVSGERDDPKTPPTILMMVIPAFDMEMRRETLRAMGMKVGSEGTLVWAIYFVTEGWVSVQMGQGPRKYRLPEDDPARKEVIQVAGLSLDGRAGAAQVEVRRNQRNCMIPGEITRMPFGGEVQVVNQICRNFFQGYVAGLMEHIEPLSPFGKN